MELSENKEIVERVPERRMRGTPKPWPKGVSGNPMGKKPGTKNKLTLYRESMLAKSERKMLENLPDILDILMEKAREGDLQAIRMYLDRMIAVKKVTEEGESTGAKGPPQVNIVIQGASGNVAVNSATLEGEFEEIIDEGSENE